MVKGQKACKKEKKRVKGKTLCVCVPLHDCGCGNSERWDMKSRNAKWEGKGKPLM